MKKLHSILLQVLFLLTVFGCNFNDQEKNNQSTVIHSEHDIKTEETLLDSMMYSSFELETFGLKVGYDLLIQDGNKFDVVGIDPTEIRFNKGDSIVWFYRRFFNGYQFDKLSGVDKIELSIDLMGDETKIIIIEKELIKEIKNWP